MKIPMNNYNNMLLGMTELKIKIDRYTARDDDVTVFFHFRLPL
jgi:hypothetical protein